MGRRVKLRPEDTDRQQDRSGRGFRSSCWGDSLPSGTPRSVVRVLCGNPEQLISGAGPSLQPSLPTAVARQGCKPSTPSLNSPEQQLPHLSLITGHTEGPSEPEPYSAALPPATHPVPFQGHRTSARQRVSPPLCSCSSRMEPPPVTSMRPRPYLLVSCPERPP